MEKLLIQLTEKFGDTCHVELFRGTIAVKPKENRGSYCIMLSKTSIPSVNDNLDMIVSYIEHELKNDPHYQ